MRLCRCRSIKSVGPIDRGWDPGLQIWKRTAIFAAQMQSFSTTPLRRTGRRMCREIYMRGSGSSNGHPPTSLLDAQKQTLVRTLDGSISHTLHTMFITLVLKLALTAATIALVSASPVPAPVLPIPGVTEPVYGSGAYSRLTVAYRIYSPFEQMHS